MGRTKKKQEEIKVKQTDNLSYKGNVVVKVVKDGKVKEQKTFKNEGGNALFLFLNKCLIGTYDAKYMPKYLVAKQLNSSVLLNPTPLSSMRVSNGSVIYSFTIPSTSFIEGTNAIEYLELYCEEYKNTYDAQSPSYSAKINGVNITVVKNAQAAVIIEWVLTISN